MLCRSERQEEVVEGRARVLVEAAASHRHDVPGHLASVKRGCSQARESPGWAIAFFASFSNMRTVAAAPLLIDDPPVASPELALVDAGLAAQLRVELTSGEAFRPREVARPAYLMLLADVDAPEPVPARDDKHGPLQVEAVEVLPAYIVVSDEKTKDLEVEDSDVAEVLDYPVTPAPVEEIEELPDYIVRGGESAVPAAVTEATDDQAPPISDYPVLPDLDERSDALDETDAALRRIREQMVVPGGKPSKPHSRVRRRFAIVSALGLTVALAAVAVDVQLGILHAPGWLAF
jgi:hypothetical protein